MSELKRMIDKLPAYMAYQKRLWSLYLYNEHISHWPSRRLRRHYLKGMLAELGQNTSVLMHVYFMNPKGVHLGNRVAINQYCILDGRVKDLYVGDDVDIGTHTHIWTLQHDPQATRDHATDAGVVYIDHHVWIASRVTILPGVTIGAGAVIATGSVVTKNVPELAVMAGIPARQIGIVDAMPDYKIRFSPFLR